MSISESINLLLEEIVDYHQNEDYKNSKKVGRRIGGLTGAIGAVPIGLIHSAIVKKMRKQ